jgi:hypothetical protein
LDRDGDQDIAVASTGESAGNTSVSDGVSILLNDGQANFTTASFIQVGGGSIDVACNDFDADGDTDLAVSGFVDDRVTVLLNGGSEGFQTAQQLGVGVGPAALLSDDIDRDGDVDLVVALAGEVAPMLLENAGPDGFRPAIRLAAQADFPFTTETPPGTGSSKSNRLAALAAHDWNQDGWLDLVFADYGTDSVTWFPSNGTGGYFPGLTMRAGPRPRGISVADVDANGEQDLVVANAESADVTLLLFQDGKFGEPWSIPANRHGNSVVVADFDQNGIADFAKANLVGTTQPPARLAGASIVLGRADYHQVDLPSPEPLELDFGNLLVFPTAAEPVARRDVGMNADISVDVDRNGTVTPLDVLLIINVLNGDTPSAPTHLDFDTNHDGQVTPLDALLVINELNHVSQQVFTRAAVAAAVDDDEDHPLSAVGTEDLDRWFAMGELDDILDPLSAGGSWER